jgi:hypothetical protein
MPKLTIADLNKIYTDAESADRDIFAEQRSNILLIAGEHYTKKNQRYQQRVRDDKTLSENQKLRLTKNHIHKVYRHYTSQILSFSPGVTVVPAQDSELQDRKDAELNKSVWLDAKYRYRMKEKVREYCGDFIGLGECAVKLFWDPNAGELQGYRPKVQKDEQEKEMQDENGNDIYERDEQGNLVPDDALPVFSGDFIFERIYGFNLLVHAGATSMRDAKCWVIRKMGNTNELEQKYKDDEAKLKFITETKDDSFIVFDSTKASYERVKGQTLIKEYYWKPSFEYPKGYFVIATDLGILEEGELPFGVFPIVWAGMDEFPTSRRARSILKVARPYQAEINRASSAMATHQITIGDDKVIYQAGTKLAPGSLLPGVRGITYQGAEPQILAGRDGSQYLDYITSQITELYDVLMMEEENEEKPNGQLDPYSMMFKSFRQQKKYSGYGEKFNQFLVDFTELYLELAKHYLPDERLIYAVGKSEQVNISEFRKTTKLCYQIRIEEQDETIETKMGKQLTMNNILQYVGKQLKPDDIGKIIRNMPFGNVDESFDDLTMGYDNAVNDMLAIERGTTPQLRPYEDYPYLINKLSHRMNLPDFPLLSPQVQAIYQNYLQQNMQAEDVRQQKIIDAKNEYIPTGGAMVACDMYVPNPNNPQEAAKRVRIPYQAMDWLVQALEKQGQSLGKLESMNQGALADMAQTLVNHQNMAPSGAPPQALPMGRNGQANPLGVS